MALWDAVTGKIYRWNSTKSEANKIVFSGLRAFILEKYTENPDLKDLFLSIRDEVYGYYAGSTYATEVNLDDLLKDYRSAIYDISVDGFLAFNSTLNMAHVTLRLLNDPESQAAMGRYVLHSEAICAMYRRPPTFLTDWQGRLDYLADIEGRGVRYSRILNDELRPYLATSRNDARPVVLLPHLALQSAECMDGYVNLPHWRAIVEERIGSIS